MEQYFDTPAKKQFLQQLPQTMKKLNKIATEIYGEPTRIAQD